jgi:hypothetical protein
VWLELEMDMLGTRLMEGGKAALPPVCAGSSIATCAMPNVLAF